MDNEANTTLIEEYRQSTISRIQNNIIMAQFEITSDGPISRAFLKKNIFNFQQAIKHIKSIPYGRNRNKELPLTVLTDGIGTCSTKHALLKMLAAENNVMEIRLMLGLFKMTGYNMPEVSETLLKYNLEYLPEAHCYLRWRGEIIDCTKLDSKPETFSNDLIEEFEIDTNQITDFKIEYHRRFLTNWLQSNAQISFTIDVLWAIREQCIQDLKHNSNR